MEFNPADYPHECPLCKSPAYIGGVKTVLCTNPECASFDIALQDNVERHTHVDKAIEKTDHTEPHPRNAKFNVQGLEHEETCPLYKPGMPNANGNVVPDDFFPLPTLFPVLEKREALEREGGPVGLMFYFDLLYPGVQKIRRARFPVEEPNRDGKNFVFRQEPGREYADLETIKPGLSSDPEVAETMLREAIRSAVASYLFHRHIKLTPGQRIDVKYTLEMKDGKVCFTEEPLDE